MAESLTIARPYAEAAFNYAREGNAMPQWSGALLRLAAVVAHPSARELIGNPKLSDEQTADILADIAGELSREQRNFLTMLAANDRLVLLPEIAELFERLRNEHEGVVDARITSAYPLTEAQLADVVSTLETKYGRKVKATVTVDRELIGGVSIRIGDEVIDTSVRGKLAQLADALMN